MKKTLRDSVKWSIGVTLAMGWVLAQAANFTVSPVRVDLSQARPSVALTVKNEVADEPLIVQLRTVAWSQDNGVDVHDPTTEVLATPPIFTVPPGGSQVVRIGLRRPPGPEREASYRLYLREVPSSPKPGFAGVQIALEMSLPVFANPNAPTAPALRWKADTEENGRIKLSVKNDGNAHAKVSNLIISASDSNRPVAALPGFAYILPGQTRNLLLEPAPGQMVIKGSALRLKANTDAGEIDLPLSAQSQ